MTSTAPASRFILDESSAVTRAMAAVAGAPVDPIVVMARAEMRHLGWLMSDVMSALGRAVNRPSGSDGWNTAAAYGIAWLTATGVTDLWVGYAETLTVAHLTNLVCFGDLAGVRLHLVLDAEQSDAQARVQANFGLEMVRMSTIDELRFAPARDNSAAASSPFPRVPRDDVTTFLATAHGTLDADAFALVESAFLVGARGGAELIASSPSPDEHQIAEALGSTLGAAASTAEALSITRGFQAALLRSGLHVRVDLERFLNRSGSVQGANFLDQGQWMLLSQFARPRDAACAVLALLGISAEEMAGLPPSAVSLDGSHVRAATGEVPVPAPARMFLTAQHLVRLAAWGSTADLFLVGDRKGALLSPRSIAIRLDRMTKATGIPLRAKHDRWKSGARSWRHRLGVTVEDVRCA